MRRRLIQPHQIPPITDSHVFADNNIQSIREDMALFDRQSRRIRDKLNYGCDDYGDRLSLQEAVIDLMFDDGY